MLRRAALLLIVAASSWMALLLVTREGPWSGRVLMSFTPSHGLHVSDLPVVGVWAVVVAACGFLWFSDGSSSRR